MVKTNSIGKSLIKLVQRTLCLVIVIGTAHSAKLSAQCTLACKSEINVSVAEGGDCTIVLTADMILNGSATSCMAGVYTGTITLGNETLISGDLAGGLPWPDAFDYIHEQVSFSVQDVGSQNSCWGYVNIEDKLPPIIVADGPVMDVVSCCDDNILIDPGTSDYAGMGGTGICALTGSGMPVVQECSAINWIVLSQVNIPNTCDGSICEDYSRVIERRLIAQDEWGATSEDTLVQHILVKRLDITNNIICPDTLTNGDALTCETLPEETIIIDGVVVPAPSVNGGGVPHLIKQIDGGDFDTIPLPPLNSGDSLAVAIFQSCNVGVRHEDRLIPKVGNCGGYTLVRNWIINEWACPAEVADTCTQVIELVDNDGPVILQSVDGFEGTTNGYTCEGNVFVPAPIFGDNCSGVERIDVTFPGGFIGDFSGNGGFITLPLGSNEVIFVAYDECHNVSEPDTVIVDVWDKTPPVVICDEHTVVSLADKGNTSVPARTFDGGSYDDCGIMEMYARRMDLTCGCTIPTYSTFSYLGENEGSHYYLSNRSFKRELAYNKAAAMDAAIFDFEGGSTSPERTYVVSQLPVSLDPATVIMAPNGVTEGRYILEVQDLCTVFRETIDFCCEDPTNQMIVLRACDHQGNFNDCMFEVELQDKLPPQIIQCPIDIMVSCGIPLNADDPNNLSDIFGTLVREDAQVNTYSFMGDNRPDDGFLAVAIGTQPTLLCDSTDAVQSDIWDGQYWDNCAGAIIDIDVVDRRNKCGIGNIYRNFSLVDGNGDVVVNSSGEKQTCQQVVQVKPEKPFDFKTIVLPVDTTVLACGLPEAYGPEITGFPEIEEGQCDLVGFNYKDQVFLFNEYDLNEPACFKIIRTWQFIDWCTIEGDDDQPYPMPAHEQIIKVRDQEAPEILFTCAERSECTFDPDCGTGFIELLKTAIDGCTGSDHLRWEAEVFIDIKATDNVVDTTYTGVGNLANASAHYPAGKHMVVWKFWDRCGNIVKCDQIFTIKNCKAPTAYCIDGLVVDLMPVDTDGDGEADLGMVELWASDFIPSTVDINSLHPCGYPVTVSFSSDIHETNRDFGCIHADERRAFDVEIYFSSIVGEGAHADTVQSFCVTSLRVQDNHRACSQGAEGRALISGQINTELDQSLEFAEVNLEGSELPASMTDANGLYAFNDMLMGGAYVVAPKKDDDHINGVSTLDLVMIQKHILGLNILDSPFKLIAADANKDQRVSASDLVELRKLILGNIDEFSSNDSWRFVDDSYVFADSSNPLNELFAEDYDIPSLNENMNIDFTAIKVGDVNNSVTMSNFSSTEVRSSNSLDLVGSAEKVGDEVRIPISTSEVENFSGIQFTLDYNNSDLNFIRIESGKLNITRENYGVKNANRGLVTFSWNTAKTDEFNNSDVLFTLVFRGQAENISNNISISSRITTAEAYTVNSEVMNINLDIDDSLASLGYSLVQNTPNPFEDATTIGFTLPRTMNAKISIHDITGKILREYKGIYNAGKNNIELSRSDLQVNGVLYYTLTAEEFSATKRMIILD